MGKIQVFRQGVSLLNSDSRRMNFPVVPTRTELHVLKLYKPAWFVHNLIQSANMVSKTEGKMRSLKKTVEIQENKYNRKEADGEKWQPTLP